MGSPRGSPRGFSRRRRGGRSANRAYGVRARSARSMTPVNAGAAMPASATKARTRRRVARSTTRQIRSATATQSAHRRQPIAATPRSATMSKRTVSQMRRYAVGPHGLARSSLRVWPLSRANGYVRDPATRRRTSIGHPLRYPKIHTHGPRWRNGSAADCPKNGGSLLGKPKSENWVNCGKPKARKRQGNPQPSPRTRLGKVQRLSAQCL